MCMNFKVRMLYMTQTKIIFFDIDGTLIDMNRKKISEKMLETLIRLQEKGIKLCLASGRAPIQIPHFEGVDFDAFLTFNGSYCYTKDCDIHSNPLSKEDVHTVIKNSTKVNRALSIATKDFIAANDADEELVAYFNVGGFKVNVADNFDELVRDHVVYQIMMSGTKEEYPMILEGVHDSKIAAWWDKAFDLIPTTGGKGVGVASILDFYGFSKEEALAFGDGGNDIEMLQTVGTGVAMGNALDHVKAIADDVCGHVAEDGIYHYCLEKGLI